MQYPALHDFARFARTLKMYRVKFLSEFRSELRQAELRHGIKVKIRIQFNIFKNCCSFITLIPCSFAFLSLEPGFLPTTTKFI